jgi:hypothetical protein
MEEFKRKVLKHKAAFEKMTPEEKIASLSRVTIN